MYTLVHITNRFPYKRSLVPISGMRKLVDLAFITNDYNLNSATSEMTAKILLTGATGYIGGTVLNQLVRSTEPSIESLTTDVLVRTNGAAEILRKGHGDRIRPILWNGFTDLSFVTDTARNYDIIINAGTGFNADGAKAFVQGLAWLAALRQACPYPG